MDTEVRPDHGSVALVEQFWRRYCAELEALADRYGRELPSELKAGAPRQPYFDYVLEGLIEQVAQWSQELLHLHNGPELLKQRLIAMQEQLQQATRASLHARVEQCARRSATGRRRWRLWK